MTVLDHARKLIADCDDEVHFERRVKRTLKRLIAEIERLEAELESIGAGGVGPLMPIANSPEIPDSSDQGGQHLDMVRAGWKLVPVEPTVEMMDAGGAATRRCYQHLNKGEVMCSYVYRHMLDAAPQPPTVKEFLTDELKPRFSAHDDAERLKSVARGMSYNDHGEAVWKHTLMEIAVRLESGGYAAPQPPGEQPPTTEQSSAVGVIGWKNHQPNSGTVVHWTTLMPPLGTKLYTHPQNLRCKSNQARLATLWGYVKAEPLTDEQIAAATGAKPGTPMWLVAVALTRAIGGEA